ncbi:hypothetical protein ACP4OV_020273 [Aristida adscensionis]
MAAAAAGSWEFALTCELLCMYMQEKKRLQQQAALAPVFVPPPPPPSPPPTIQEGDWRTMQLFPARTVPPAPPLSLSLSLQGNVCKPEVEGQLINKGTLTIFYGRRVVAFDDFPADKAKELMEMAGSVTSQAPENKDELALELGMPGAAVLQLEDEEEETLVDLPIARKASLKRFLHKRKHTTTDDYDPYGKAPVDWDAGAGAGGSGGRRGDDEPGPSWFGGSWHRL